MSCSRLCCLFEGVGGVTAGEVRAEGPGFVVFIGFWYHYSPRHFMCACSVCDPWTVLSAPFLAGSLLCVPPGDSEFLLCGSALHRPPSPSTGLLVGPRRGGRTLPLGESPSLAGPAFCAAGQGPSPGNSFRGGRPTREVLSAAGRAGAESLDSPSARGGSWGGRAGVSGGHTDQESALDPDGTPPPPPLL